jgi:hypothetical protein
MPSLAMNRFSRCAPGATSILAPGGAASSAAWMDWPGRTSTLPGPPAA